MEIKTITYETIEHLKRWEGLRLDAYPDPGSKDGTPYNIGYGQTSYSFMRVWAGLKITEVKAEQALRHDADEAVIDRLVKVPLTANRRGALISFVFKVDAGSFGKPTLLKGLNEGKYDAVPGELAKRKYNDGKVMHSLINRRAAEAGLWAKGEFVASRGVGASTAPAVKQALRPEVFTAAGGVIAAGGGGGDRPIRDLAESIVFMPISEPVSCIGCKDGGRFSDLPVWCAFSVLRFPRCR